MQMVMKSDNDNIKVE